MTDRVSVARIPLLILPTLMLIIGLVMISYISPIYSGVQWLDYDPAYQYLFNGAALMKGYGPSHTDHPGTPAQLLIGLITLFSWCIATLGGLTSLPFPQSVATSPEAYLRVVMTAFLVMNCAAVHFVGLAIARSTRAITAGLACQSAYFLLGPLFPRIFHAAPEAMLFLAGAALMAVLAPVIFDHEECSDRRAVAVGVFLGLGVCSKVTFFPLFLLALVLKRPRPVFIALSSGVLFFFVFALPIIDKLKGVFSWLTVIGTHQGTYGEGGTGFIDWSAVPERARLIALAEPLLIVAAIALTAIILVSKPRDRLTAAVMALALGGLTFLTLKHFAIHYLMPAVAIAPAVIVWAMSRFSNRQMPYLTGATVALVLGAFSIQNTISAFADERSLRSQNEKAVNEVLAKYQNPVVIHTYRSGYKPWAVHFGLAAADLKFMRLVPGALAGDTVAYDAGLKKLWRRDTRALEWSYLDQFEKAGRAVLIVQPRNTKSNRRPRRPRRFWIRGLAIPSRESSFRSRSAENKSCYRGAGRCLLPALYRDRKLRLSRNEPHPSSVGRQHSHDLPGRFSGDAGALAIK